MIENQPGKADSAVTKILSILSESNGYVTLGIEAAGVIIPLVKGLVGEIKKIGGGAETESYQILITADLAELDDVSKLATDDLTAINAELARLGKPQVQVPSEGTAGPAADPAPGSNSLT